MTDTGVTKICPNVLLYDLKIQQIHAKHMAQIFKKTNSKHYVTLILDPPFKGLTEEEKIQGNPL